MTSGPQHIRRGPYPGQGLRYLIRHVHRSFTKLIEAELAREVSITYPQWSFLRLLLEKDGVSQRELSDQLGLMENTTVSALKVMEKRGWIVRERDPTDARRMLIKLTPEGRTLDRLRPRVRDINHLAVEGLDPKAEEAVRAGLEIMLANLERAYARQKHRP
jgi:DNA-binding MarR family transcriptional regulator